MPLLSIVIPLFNKSQYVSKTMHSIMTQSFRDFEVIIVDDSSTDDSLEIITHLFIDERIKIIRQINGGPASARNTGLRNAIGDWIVFMDADDVFLPGAFELFHQLISNNSNINYYIANYYFQKDDQCFLASHKKHYGIVKRPFLWEYLELLSGRPGTELIKRSFAISYPFDERLRRYEDAECQYRMLNHTLPFQTDIPVMISNRDASEAAGYRKDIREDFLGCLNFSDKTFWEKMQLYKLAKEALCGYYEAKDLYDSEYRNIVYRLTEKIVNWYKRFILVFEQDYTDESVSYDELMNSQK